MVGGSGRDKKLFLLPLVGAAAAVCRAVLVAAVVRCRGFLRTMAAAAEGCR